MDFQLYAVSEQPFLLAQILDIIIKINELDKNVDNIDFDLDAIKEDIKNQVDDEISKYKSDASSQAVTIETILKKQRKNAIVFETCNGTLKFNSFLESSGNTETIMIAFDDKTLYAVVLKEGDKESFILKDIEKTREALDYSKQKFDKKLDCIYSLGSLVKVSGRNTDVKAYQVCGISKDTISLLSNKDLKYFDVSIKDIEAAEDSTTQIELNNRFLEASIEKVSTEIDDYTVKKFKEFYTLRLGIN